MMFGRRDRFAYAECPACASLQIREVPANLADYYPPEYSAYDLPAALKGPPLLHRRLASWLLNTLPGCTPLTRRLAPRYPFLHWARLGNVRHDSAILDVGCGAGGPLRRWRRCGYRDLTGVDPYLKEESDEPGLVLRRGGLDAVTGTFDLIMMHHVLEHMPDPAGALRLARCLLRPGGSMLVRVPLAGSPLAREFGADWFNLDAPRHLVIPSREGMRGLAAAAGLRICHEECDGIPLSLLYSECYRRNVAMKEAAEPGTAADLKRADRLMKKLNRAGRGDWGVFVLQPAA
jgi:SAM-dependent methyltransferase